MSPWSKERVARAEEWRLKQTLGGGYAHLLVLRKALDYLDERAKHGFDVEDELLFDEVKEALELFNRKYNPNQPRVPSGNPGGGQWTGDGSAGGAATDGATNHTPFPSVERVADSGRILSDGDSAPSRPVAAADYAEHHILDPEKYPYGNHACATHVRAAIEDATGKTMVRPASGDAKDYGGSLVGIGFKPIAGATRGDGYDPARDGYEPKAGDVIVIQSTSKSAPGHMAIYKGQDSKGDEIWVSDFIQKSGPYPGPSYREEKPAFTIYRYQD